jgi:hypothetical protein
MVGIAGAQEIWTGPPVNFTKAGFADWTLPANQDRITDNVWITRQDNRAIFNIKVETEYSWTNRDSPLDTEWAVGDIADWATLTYQPLYLYANSKVGDNILNLGPSVVHLITDDIYIPIEFTDWSGSGDGGPFSYTRGTRDPSPVEATTWSAIKALYNR